MNITTKFEIGDLVVPMANTDIQMTVRQMRIELSVDREGSLDTYVSYKCYARPFPDLWLFEYELLPANPEAIAEHKDSMDKNLPF